MASDSFPKLFSKSELSESLVIVLSKDVEIEERVIRVQGGAGLRMQGNLLRELSASQGWELALLEEALCCLDCVWIMLFSADIGTSLDLGKLFF